MRTIEIITLVTAIIGAVCGICGAVLGILNTWSQLSRNRVRLKVVPKLAFMVSSNDVITASKPTRLYKEMLASGTPSRWCIEIINLSAFPVTISSVGFGKADKTRHVLHRPEVSPGKTWPTRLEAREAVTLYGELGGSLDPEIMQFPYAFAETDCGIVCYGTSPMFEGYCRSLTSK
jgi:hypothetical protein